MCQRRTAPLQRLDALPGRTRKAKAQAKTTVQSR
eukprot:SAG25_NODE_1221_length_3571_cov_1.954781_1_plen_33_part_10